VYVALRTALSVQVDTLRSEDPEFDAQWQWIERENGPDPAIAMFMPDTYYRLGGYGRPDEEE
jgi:hypothetical protein